MKVCIGGTFDIIHKGHEILISKAFEVATKEGFVFIGLTKNNLIDKKKNVKNWYLRKKNLERYISKKDYKADFIIEGIEDIYGPTIENDFDAIVVSKETEENAKKIKKKKKDKNKKPMKIIIIPYLYAEDNLPISTTRIKKGEINKDGKRLYYKSK